MSLYPLIDSQINARTAQTGFDRKHFPFDRVVEQVVNGKKRFYDLHYGFKEVVRNGKNVQELEGYAKDVTDTANKSSPYYNKTDPNSGKYYYVPAGTGSDYSYLTNNGKDFNLVLYKSAYSNSFNRSLKFEAEIGSDVNLVATFKSDNYSHREFKYFFHKVGTQTVGLLEDCKSHTFYSASGNLNYNTGDLKLNGHNIRSNWWIYSINPKGNVYEQLSSDVADNLANFMFTKNMTEVDKTKYSIALAQSLSNIPKGELSSTSGNKYFKDIYH